MPIVLLTNQYALCVEVPEGLERSCEGSLHFRPYTPRVITADELEVLKADPAANGNFQELDLHPEASAPKGAKKSKRAKKSASTDDKAQNPTRAKKSKGSKPAGPGSQADDNKGSDDKGSEEDG